MRKDNRLLKTLILGLSCLSATVIAASSSPAKSEPQSPQLTNAEILDLVSGNTTIGTFSDRPVSYAVYLTEDGQMIAQISEGTEETIELGQWRVADDLLCGQWENLGGGEESCFTYYRVGSNIHAYNADGSLNRIQFFVDGDPLGLQQTSNRASTLPDFEKVIREEYFSLWRDTEADPYSVELARQLYLTDERLTALDTDALLLEGADSRLEGWSEYAPIWPEVFEQIARFEARDVSNFNVQQEGNWALVSFDMAGESELESGETFDVFKHFTLVWMETEDGWRIFHEHISDGQPPETAS